MCVRVRRFQLLNLWHVSTCFTCYLPLSLWLVSLYGSFSEWTRKQEILHSGTLTMKVCTQLKLIFSTLVAFHSHENLTFDIFNIYFIINKTYSKTHDDTWLSEWRPAHVAEGSKKPVRPDCFALFLRSRTFTLNTLLVLSKSQFLLILNVTHLWISIGQQKTCISLASSPKVRQKAKKTPHICEVTFDIYPFISELSIFIYFIFIFFLQQPDSNRVILPTFFSISAHKRKIQQTNGASASRE